MVADVPVGAFLSGGIDSSLVVALMQANASHPVRTFTIGFPDVGWDEASWARAVATHLGTEHTELYVTSDDALAIVPTLPELYDEPFADSSQIPTFIVSRLARQQVSVALSGDGGDELFGGYDRYGLAERRWRAVQRIPHTARKAAADVSRYTADRRPEWRSPDKARWLPPALRGKELGHLLDAAARTLPALSLSQLYVELISDFGAPSQVVLRSHEPRTRHRSIDASGLDDREQLMLLDLVTYLPDDILVKVDRATMAVGLEARVPLLAQQLVEFTWSLPPNLKYQAGGAKWILREVLGRFVPSRLVDRPKMGFGVPVGSWLRGPLHEWAAELLRPSRLADEGYFDPAPIQSLWIRHCDGLGDWERQLWPVLMFQAWLEEMA